jgi:hypothetical protein
LRHAQVSGFYIATAFFVLSYDVSLDMYVKNNILMNKYIQFHSSSLSSFSALLIYCVVTAIE